MPPTLSRLVRSAVRIVRLPLEKPFFTRSQLACDWSSSRVLLALKASRERWGCDFMLISGRLWCPWCPPACGGLGFARNTPHLWRLLPASGHELWRLLCPLWLAAKRIEPYWYLGFVSSCSNGLPRLFRSNGFSDESPAGASRKICFDSVRDLIRTNRSPLLLHEPDNVIEAHEDAGDFKDR